MMFLDLLRYESCLVVVWMPGVAWFDDYDFWNVRFIAVVMPKFLPTDWFPVFSLLDVDP